MTNALTRTRVVALVAALSLLAAACGDGPDGGSADAQADAVATYAEGVHAAYAASAASAGELDAVIDSFLADPSEAGLQAAKDAWLTARDDYGPTEAFRFYDGPIDEPEHGPEGLINAWPMDESYVDYVEGAPEDLRRHGRRSRSVQHGRIARVVARDSLARTKNPGFGGFVADLASTYAVSRSALFARRRGDARRHRPSRYCS